MRNQPAPVPAALYARVSSERQDVDLSVAAQLRALRNYAAQHGYVVAREYVDEAESGRVADRPEFRKLLDAGGRPQAPFQVILVWKFSRFTRKREHAVAFKAMLRRKGIRVVSITEHADDSPTGKLMEAIIESVDEFYSENLAQEVTRGMREAASRGFWVSSRVPYGYTRVLVPDGAKERPKLAVVEPAAGVVRRLFALADRGQSLLDITRTLNAEGIASPQGKRWLKSAVHRVLTNEVYTGTLVWGRRAKDQAPPVRVPRAFPAIVSRAEFRRVATLLASRGPTKVHPRRSASSYLLSGLVKCRRCGRALSGQAAKGGQFAYYVCQSLLHRGRAACDAPRLNARRFEGLIVEQIRDSILTADNLRALVRLVDAELDGLAHEQRRKLTGIETELAAVQRRLDRVWHVIETSDLGARGRHRSDQGAPGTSGAAGAGGGRNTGPVVRGPGRCWITCRPLRPLPKTCATICGQATARSPRPSSGPSSRRLPWPRARPPFATRSPCQLTIAHRTGAPQQRHSRARYCLQYTTVGRTGFEPVIFTLKGDELVHYSNAPSSDLQRTTL